MKTFLTWAFAFAALTVTCCDFNPDRYIVSLPQPPESWVSLLGEPCWRLEWFDPGGRKQTADIFSGEHLEIKIPVTFANPVTAWPYWPKHNLIPGHFKPAGALFPFDAGGNTIKLSWESGPDVIFYNEIGIANGLEQAKPPANFDWLRFRELFKDSILNEDVLKDPWLVDWQSVAEKTVSSSFDRRRLVPEQGDALSIPVPSCLWYGTSPFSAPLVFEEDERPAFPVRPGINVWVSEKGILQVNGGTWLLKTWGYYK